MRKLSAESVIYILSQDPTQQLGDIIGEQE